MKSFLFCVSLLYGTLCLGQTNYSYTQPTNLQDGWLIGDLLTKNVDTSRVYQLFSQLKDGAHQLHSVLLVQKEQLLIEEYYAGHTADSLHDLRSVTKSIRSILMGIAIDQGFIDSVDDPISKYLRYPSPKKNLDPRKEQITIRNLLTMSSGLECNDWDPKSAGQEDRVYRKKDWIQYTLDLPMVNDPGTVSNYCSMGVLLIAEIISQASGMTIDSFAAKYLFAPLGITKVHWGHTSKKEVIASGKRIYLSSRDLAKIGLLVLQNGKWKDNVVVSEAWMQEATTPKTQITGVDYGYLWWTIPFTINDETVKAITATGNGGQYIMVLPALEMIAIFTGGAYNSQEDKLPFAIVKNVFLPTFYKR